MVKEMATVCVTGASGFIGSWLVMRLLERGYTVRATVRDPGQYLPLLVFLWFSTRTLHHNVKEHKIISGSSSNTLRFLERLVT